MKKTLSKSFLLTALVIMLIACLTGATVAFRASAQSDPTSVVTFTSSTTVMKVDEEFEFAAVVTNEDGTTSTDVTWSSSDEEIIYIEDGLATALAEGTATITATAEDGAFASVEVNVSNSAIHVESIELYPNVLELGVDWETRVGYTIVPGDATDQRVTLASSNPSVISIDENGNVKALAAGTAVITATTYDSSLVATCDVTVYANLGEATITPDPLVTTIGQVVDNDLTVTFPADVSGEGATYHWYSMNDSIASVDLNDDATGSIFSWAFGTTTIRVVATTADGAKYAASATVHVTAPFFYLTGLEEDLADPTNPDVTPWVTYETAEEAEAAGVLLVQNPDKPYEYSITRSFWALDNFQIIHGDIKEGWATRITPSAFVEQEESQPYIANDAETFAVNALGTYTVTLDLTDGPAKVTILVGSLKVTSFDLSVASENAYLQYDASAGEDADVATRTMLLDVYTIPHVEEAEYALADVSATVPANMAQYVTAEPIQDENGSLQIRLTLLKAVAENTAFQLTVEIDNHIDGLSNAINDITITVLADGAEYVPVTSIEFTSKNYTVNVNNGATPWISSTPIEAVVNAGASVDGVVYSEDSDHLYIEYIDGLPYVHADAFGVYTIYANALGNSKLDAAEATVLVTSQVEPTSEEDKTSGFYLIGRLDGVEVNNWASIVPEETDYTSEKAQLFAPWALDESVLTYDEDTGALISAIYTGTFNFRAGDVFSIAFLGMNGNWASIINNQYMDWAASDGTFWNNDINIEFAETGRYTVTLTIDANGPSFSVRYAGTYNPETEYNLWLYVVRCGDSWDGSLTDEGNVLVTVGYIHINKGVAESMTLTTEGYDFYEFYTSTNEWPDVQFVTAYTLDGEGIEGGYFQNATWYGYTHTGITFSGTAYSEAIPDEGANVFTNYEGRSELYWAAHEITGDMEGKMTVEFTFTFDEGGVLTEVELNFVPAPTEPAE